MKLEEVMQMIDKLIEYYGEERWGDGEEAAYHEGAFDVLRKLRDAIKQKGGAE